MLDVNNLFQSLFWHPYLHLFIQRNVPLLVCTSNAMKCWLLRRFNIDLIRQKNLGLKTHTKEIYRQQPAHESQVLQTAGRQKVHFSLAKICVNQSGCYK